MPHLNPFAISGLLIIIAYTPLFIFLLIKGKSKITRIYSLHILAIFLWGIGSFLVGITQNADAAIIIWKIAYSWVLFIPVFFLHTVLILTREKSKLLLIFSYLQALVFLIATLTNTMFQKPLLLKFNSFYYFNGHPKYYLSSFLIWEFLAIITQIKLFLYYQKIFPSEKKKVLFLLVSTVGFIGGTTNFLPGFGINIYPVGNFLVPINSFAVIYAILRHQLLDIEIAYKKGMVYSILFTTLLLSYLLVVVTFEKFLQQFFGYKSFGIGIFTAFMVGLIFVPLRNRIQYYVDKLFFQGSPMEIAEENKRLRLEIVHAEKLKTIAIFASGIAHEIKNPLTAIKTFSEYLPNKINDKGFLRNFSKIVGKEAGRIDGLVHQLLEYAKPSAPVLKETKILHLIDTTMDLFNNDFLKHKIQIIKDHNLASSFTLNIDPNQIKQALINIFLNAIDAIMPDGGTLAVTTHGRMRTTPAVDLPSMPRYITIAIRDTGCGIPKEDLPHIFDPFFTKKNSGTGLGLAITHEIIKKHDGRILVESIEGKGTLFIIELPIEK